MGLEVTRIILLVALGSFTVLAKENCSQITCFHEGICQDTEQGYACICKPGFSGRNCESKNPDCIWDNPCKNGACKLDSSGNPECFCSPGFAGKFCEIDEDECQSQPCQSGGACLDSVDGFMCNCTKGTFGKLCEITQTQLDAYILTCHSDKFTKCWREDTRMLAVEWGYGYSICNTVHNCFGGENDTETNTYDRFVDVQLHPAQLQIGDSLNLTLDERMIQFAGELMPQKLPVVKLASDDAFVNCNPNGSIPVDIPADVVVIGSKNLPEGRHYFMTDIDETFRCDFGLRLNVSVKDNHCKHPDSPTGEYCLQRGRCQTNFSFTDFRCECHRGFYGQFCEKFDYCYDNPCKHGKCTSREDLKTAVCSCDPGFIGYDCSIMLDMCLSDPCQNNGTCVSKPNDYQCVCPPGYTGINCQTDIDECAAQPCKNGGTCTDKVAAYSCQCITGFEGKDCEINIDECKDNRCKFGVCVDHVNRYSCKCDPGYVGVFCEFDLDECVGNPCLHGGKCIDQVNAYKCECGVGYRGNRCEIDLDLCSDPTFCMNSANCTDHGNSVTCVCSHGYKGQNCATAVDWCLNKPCLNGGICKLNPPEYSCTCRENYAGEHCEINMLHRQTIAMKLMMEDCNRVKNRALQDFYGNFSTAMSKACKCAFTSSNVVPNSMKLQCENSITAQLVLEIETAKHSPQKLLCQMTDYAEKKKFINIGHDSYIVKVLTKTDKCNLKDAEKADKGPILEKETENVDMSSVAIAIGLCIALAGLAGATFFILYRCRRRVEANKEKARSDDKRIDDLSIDLLAAVAPTPKSMYRTTGYRGSMGYTNMAFSSPFEEKTTLKSRKV